MKAVEIVFAQSVNPVTEEVKEKIIVRMDNGSMLDLLTPSSAQDVNGRRIPHTPAESAAYLRTRFAGLNDALRHVQVRESIVKDDNGNERLVRFAVVSQQTLGETLTW